jgi:hypothetical protein
MFLYALQRAKGNSAFDIISPLQKAEAALIWRFGAVLKGRREKNKKTT